MFYPILVRVCPLLSFIVPKYACLIIAVFCMVGNTSLVSAATVPGPGTTPGPDLPTTFLQGSLDLGDLGFNFQTEINIEGTERLIFQWKTNEEAAVSGQYAVMDENGVVLLVGDPLPSPPLGEYRLFFIEFANPEDVAKEILKRTTGQLFEARG